MATAVELDKAKRGTKRVCPECETRFYDLLRKSISCPSCGVAYTPAAHQTVAASLPSFSPGKRSRYYKHQERPLSEPAPSGAEAASVNQAEAIDDEPAEPEDRALDNDTVLEQDADGDDDLAGLVDHDEKEPKAQ